MSQVWGKQQAENLKRLLFDVYRDEFGYGSPKIAERFANDERHKTLLVKPYKERSIQAFMYGNKQFNLLRLDAMLKAVGVEEGIKAVL
jgi:hypothetical protein